MNKFKVSGRRFQVAGTGKKGQMAEGIHMMYRLMMVSLVAFIVFSAGSLSYNYYIDVRDVEARILAREVVECLTEDGHMNLDAIGEDDKDAIVRYCGISQVDRFYVGAEIRWQDAGGRTQVVKLQEGDSGSLWVRDLFEKAGDLTDNAVLEDAAGKMDRMVQYEPGYFLANYSVFFVNEGEREKGKIKMEVLVNYEE